jgi:hypothetical protein
MTLARLVAAALVMCSLSAFGQDRQAEGSQLSTSPCSWGCPVPGNLRGFKFFFFDWSHYNVATTSEPWRIFPDSHSLVSGQTRLDQIPADQLKLEFRVRQLLQSQLDRLREEGPTCYAIRSYVVARDSRDSDSTHPAGYSTCQPAARYGVKTTEIRSTGADR